MGLVFVGDAGVYLPKRDAIRITAIEGDRVVECLLKASALAALGCPQNASGEEMLRHFERHRDVIEIAAMVKYRRALTPMIEVDVTAADVAMVLPAVAA